MPCDVMSGAASTDGCVCVPPRLPLPAYRMGRALKRRPTRHSSSRLHSAAGTAPGSPRAGAGPQPEALPRLQPAPPAAPLPASSGLRRSSSLARLSAWRQLQPQPQGGTGGDDEDEDENEGGLMGRLPSQLQHLQRQAAPAPSGLRTSKSFGGHLAELMQVGLGFRLRVAGRRRSSAHRRVGERDQPAPAWLAFCALWPAFPRSSSRRQPGTPAAGARLSSPPLPGSSPLPYSAANRQGRV